MPRTSIAFSIIFLLLSQLPRQAIAGENLFDEIRFGGAISDVVFSDQKSYYEYDRAAINAEVLFSPLNLDFRDQPEEGFLRQLATPRIHLGGTLGLEKYGISSIYSGLTWRFPVTSRFFVETSFGAAVHNGKLKVTRIVPGHARRGLGSTVLFRESIALGVAVTDNLNMIVQLSHMSHAGLAGGENAGQTNIHFKLGWKM